MAQSIHEWARSKGFYATQCRGEPVEYLPATDLEQLREALRELVDAEDAAGGAKTFDAAEVQEARYLAALSHARDLLTGGRDEA